MDKLIERLRALDTGARCGSAPGEAADRLEKVRDFLKMLEDPETAPDAKWCATRARELLA